MTCDEARIHLLDLQRGHLAPPLAQEVSTHVATCPACARAREEEALLDAVLQRLPRSPASPALRRRLSALAASAVRAAEPDTIRRPARGARAAAWSRLAVPALAAAAAVLAVSAILLVRSGPRPAVLPPDALASEAVGDHLRVLQRRPPLDVESAGTHDVKPWFEGRLDFAPSVPGPVAPEMRLAGGTLGYFLDRPAAVIVYRFRLHVVTLLAFRADGLAWPGPAGAAAARAPVRRDLRGFHVYLWRAGELGYALVGDVDPAELTGIAAKLAAQT